MNPIGPLAPAIGYGGEWRARRLPGTVSIGTSALRLLLVEFGRSASQWGIALVFVNGHGGNVEALRSLALLPVRGARRRLVFVHRRECRNAHAGHTETLYCYIFRRPTCGPTSASPAIARPGGVDTADASWRCRRRERTRCSRRPDDRDSRGRVNGSSPRMVDACLRRIARWAPDGGRGC